MHPKIMHTDAINSSDNINVLDFISRSFLLIIGTFSVKFMQKLCKMSDKAIKVQDINGLDLMGISPD
jgi:hypothetical protein